MYINAHTATLTYTQHLETVSLEWKNFQFNSFCCFFMLQKFNDLKAALWVAHYFLCCCNTEKSSLRQLWAIGNEVGSLRRWFRWPGHSRSSSCCSFINAKQLPLFFLYSPASIWMIHRENDDLLNVNMDEEEKALNFSIKYYLTHIPLTSFAGCTLKTTFCHVRIFKCEF